MSEEKELTPLAMSARTAIIMVLFTIVFTALMAGTYVATKPIVDASAEAEKLRLINAVLDPGSYDNALLRDALTLPSAPELGIDGSTQIWRARKNGQPVALVMEAVAPNGYAGRVKLVLAVMADGTLGGVRVTEHRETPGLGDYIDPAKDKNKSSPWITQFVGRSLERTPFERFKVKKDGGDITYRAGATISPRAVTNAVALALKYAHDNKENLFR